MKKILVVFYSKSGITESMAQYIAEGIRFTGNQAEVRKMDDIRSSQDLEGYDGIILGAPTYYQDLPEEGRKLLELMKSLNLNGRLAGAFASYRHEVGYTKGGQSADIALDLMENTLKMRRFDLGALKLKDDMVDTVEGMRACQDYGRIFAQSLS
ncbi:MAG: flavodoxin domain-containing protein [Dehalococcoidales bacterium]|nr:flavodoxin domain-containing protein [Dehalococcoidales bacterium]